MKKIIVIEWLKFVNANKPIDLVFENVYKLGYWNVLKHTDYLEAFLMSQKIRYQVTEESLL